MLKDLISESDRPQITSAIIMAVTAEYFTLTLDDLTGSSRSRMLTTARQIAMYLCRELTDLSLPKIGQTFGGPRSHTTVMHADRKIRSQMTERMSVYNQVAELTSRINGTRPRVKPVIARAASSPRPRAASILRTGLGTPCGHTDGRGGQPSTPKAGVHRVPRTGVVCSPSRPQPPSVPELGWTRLSTLSTPVMTMTRHRSIREN